jgi:hypothetical protein
MPLGIQTTKEQVNNNLGAMAINLRESLEDLGNLSQWLISVEDSDLTSLGFTTDEVAEIRLVILNMVDLVWIWNGFAPVTVTLPFSFVENVAEFYGAQ